jgi:hypothetical protein
MCPLFDEPPPDEDREGLTWTSVVAAAHDLHHECRSHRPVRLRKDLAHKSVNMELVLQQRQGGLRLAPNWQMWSLIGVMALRGASSCRASGLHPQQ